MILKPIRLLLPSRAITVLLALWLPTGCVTANVAPADNELTWTAYRVRDDAAVGLNADHGWAAAVNQRARLAYDQPFRLRIEVESTTQAAPTTELRLEYRKDGGPWQRIGLSDFPYPLYATPPASLLGTTGYAYGEESEDLLRASTLEHEDGIGLAGVSATPLFRLGVGSMEWEWPLVIRRFADGPAFHEDGSTYEIRVVDHRGQPLPGRDPVALEMFAPPGHLGGTFVETPARIGPYQTASGRLYFLMEPTESDNRFMIVASDDFGRSWREVDGANRPAEGDLEGVGAAFVDGVIHIVHQISEAVFHHAFATDAVSASPDQWLVDSALIATHSEPPTQSAALNARPDGTLLAVYGDATGGFLHICSPDGRWAEAGIPLETPEISGLSGFQLATGADGQSYVVYTAADGTGWLRTISPANELSRPLLISDTLGTADASNGAFLPLLTPESGGVVLIYRKADGALWERRYLPDEGLSRPRVVTPGPVVTNAVDAEQVGADAVLHGNTAHVLFIDEATRALFHTSATLGAPWEPSRLLIDGIDAAWVRGSVVRDEEGELVYGFVYDAGSKGGAGMNRYATMPLP